MVKYIENRKMFFRKVKEENNKIYISKINKNIAKKVIKKLNKDEVKNVVCDREIMKNEEFKNYLYSNRINIYNGIKLYKNILQNIFEFIEDKGINLKQKNAAILINDNSEINRKIVYNVAKYFRQITIVTNNIGRFLKIEKELEESGIPINISNNKKKCLRKREIIINIDFPEELINKYTIYERAIIINIEENVVISDKKFNGINLNYYELDLDDKYNKYEKFDKNIIEESMIIESKLHKYNLLKIKNLIGNRGIINNEEFKKLAT